MARPLKGDEPLDHRMQLLLSDSDVAAIDDWRFANRVGSRSEAIRRLIELGLQADASGWVPSVDESADPE